jgi:hypothetical protein
MNSDSPRSDSPVAAAEGPVHPALLLLGLGQPASPEESAEGPLPTASSPAQPAFLLLGLHQAADPTTDGVQP